MGNSLGDGKLQSWNLYWKKLLTELVASLYRPVSNLSFLSKLLEKAVMDQFMQQC